MCHMKPKLYIIKNSATEGFKIGFSFLKPLRSLFFSTVNVSTLELMQDGSFKHTFEIMCFCRWVAI